MPEYIERDTTCGDCIHSEICKHIPTLTQYSESNPAYCKLFKNAADVAPVVHGRWVQVVWHVEFEDGFVDRLYECCSHCHEPNGRKTSNYYPNCGARMDGE